MKKRSFWVAAILSMVMLFSCVLFAGCDLFGKPSVEETEKRTITWNYDENAVTVEADNYNALPTELAEETEVFFTVDVKEGYELTSVSGAKKQADGSYSFTVGTRNITVKINTNKILNAIELTKYPEKMEYFEDQTIDSADFELTAHYAMGDEIVTDYTVIYAKGDAFTKGDTSFEISFGGKSVTVKLTKAVQLAVDFTHTGLKVDEAGDPVLVITGIYHASNDKERAKEFLEGYFHDVMENQSWANKEYESIAVINDDMSFTLEMTIKGTMAGKQYFAHIRDGSDGNDFACASVDTEPVYALDGTAYHLGIYTPWGSKPVFLYVVNENAPKFVSVGLEEKGGKPYAVFNGTASNELTAETLETQLLKMITHLDMEDVLNGNAKLADFVHEGAWQNTEESTIAFLEFDQANGTFKLYLLLEGEGIKDGAAFFAHLGAQNNSGYYPNVSLPGDEAHATLTCGGYMFTLTDADSLGIDYSDSSNAWKSSLIYIQVTAIVEEAE